MTDLINRLADWVWMNYGGGKQLYAEERKKFSDSGPTLEPDTEELLLGIPRDPDDGTPGYVEEESPVSISSDFPG